LADPLLRPCWPVYSALSQSGSRSEASTFRLMLPRDITEFQINCCSPSRFIWCVSPESDSQKGDFQSYWKDASVLHGLLSLFRTIALIDDDADLGRTLPQNRQKPNLENVPI
jgi:hypothetical protein